MRIFPFRSIESTCPTWRKARRMIESRIPRPLEFQYENDKRLAVGTNTVSLDELWRICPAEAVEDMRGRIYTMAVYLHHAVDLDSMREKFIDRPSSSNLIDTMNDALREKDAERVRLGLASFDELIRHALGICETSKALNLVIET